ncbi:MAG: hypothetical protein IKT93_01700, partial [Clostridia bacterium]|nr:hypothetical protein [Clostridia bacterium]
AMGCTEPIAIAYAAAKAKAVLGTFPTSCDIAVSGNIIKNAKSVVVPHTGGMRGIETAVVAGLVGGNADARLEVLSHVSHDDVERMRKISDTLPIKVSLSDSDYPFDIILSLTDGKDNVSVRITNRHTNIVSIIKNNEKIFEGDATEDIEIKKRDLSVEEIIEFANSVDIEDIRPTIKRQIDCNMAIAEEGLRSPWGANIGKLYLVAQENAKAIIENSENNASIINQEVNRNLYTINEAHESLELLRNNIAETSKNFVLEVDNLMNSLSVTKEQISENVDSARDAKTQFEEIYNSIVK